jgi:hypothetical protein
MTYFLLLLLQTGQVHRDYQLPDVSKHPIALEEIQS